MAFRIEMDFNDNSILIPKEIVDALGSPPEINFLLKQEQGILGIAGEIHYSFNGKKQPGRPRKKSRIADSWDEAAGAYRISTAHGPMRRFGEYIRGFNGEGIYALTGELADNKCVVLFAFSGAELLGGTGTEQETKLRRRIGYPNAWNRAASVPGQT